MTSREAVSRPRCTSFIDEFQSVRPADDSDYFVTLVHRWRRFPFIDPGLPATLLPTPWIGTQAAQLHNSLLNLWKARATQKWNELVRAADDAL
jgi:phenylacetic acid degradation operon negative regulatory protein